MQKYLYPSQSVFMQPPWPFSDLTAAAPELNLVTVPQPPLSRSCSASSLGLDLERSLGQLERDTHDAVGLIRKHVQGAKGTGVTYAQHVQHYQEFWEGEELLCQESDPHHALIPAYPITAAKVAKFVMSEMKREKVSDTPVCLFAIQFNPLHLAETAPR